MLNIKTSRILTISVSILALILVLIPSFQVSAQYDCGAYGYSTYGNQQDCGGAGGSSGGGLSDTGQALYFVVPAGLIVVGSIGLFKLSRASKLKKSKKTELQAD